MTTYDNGCVETPEWETDPRPSPFEQPEAVTIPATILLGEN